MSGGKSNQEYWRLYKLNNKDKIKQSVIMYREKTRERLYDILGRECKCGVNDIDVLQFDHINNDGNIGRKLFGSAGNELSYYSRRPDEAVKRFQVLCANCNIKKNKVYLSTLYHI